MRTIRMLTAPAAIVAFALAACSGDRITGSADPSLQSLSLSKSTPVERPWKGTCDLSAQFIGPTTLSITGTCQLAHLGRTSVSLLQQLGPGPIDYSNVGTYTAANGDQLYTTNIGTGTPTLSGQLVLLGTETATGGTGRFANATGTAGLNGLVTFTGLTSATATYSLDGRLSY